MEAKYIPADHESAIAAEWEARKAFQPSGSGEPFSMVLPPPNATGDLHLGHALMLVIEDCITRYQRASGKKTVWVPGTDHAAIATQAKVEKMLPEGTSRHTLGREKFLKRVEAFVEESQDTIRKQIRIMGASLDWTRERYTLGDNESALVQQVFVKMYEDGLIYRGIRVINWDPKSQSAIADDEVLYEPQRATLYHIKYTDDIIVATSQPETKLGDTAIAVHPSDERYKHLIGQKLEVKLAGHPITVKVIADEEVDPAFGSGVLGVTPAHSMTDYQLSLKHNLSSVQLYDGSGVMTKAAGKYAHMSIVDARARFITDLEASGQLIRTEEYDREIPISERTGVPILHIPSQQWFVAVDKPFKSRWGEKTLKELSLEVVRNGEIKIVPERFGRSYEHWMSNLHDWCISRQIWFGHRIPAYYSSAGHTYVGLTPPSDNADEIWSQDHDTLDTWFSSGMWTFSCFLLPKKENESLQEWIARSKAEGELGAFHPTSVLETGYDIIFFWVARMILLTTYVMDEVPFKKVYLHGIVRDEQGRKFSKSLGNGIDPRKTVASYGADATRLALLLGSTPGNDSKISVPKIEGYRNYVTKIWNVARFISLKLSEDHTVAHPTVADRWILSRLQSVLAEVKRGFDEDRLSDAGLALYDFTWHELADWYLEMGKVEGFAPHKETLERVLRTLLQVHVPFTPFVVEAIHRSLWPHEPMLSAAPAIGGAVWPLADAALRDETLEQDIQAVQTLIERIRFLRAERKVPAGEVLSATIIPSMPIERWERYYLIVEKMARVRCADGVFGDSDASVAGFDVRMAWPAAAERDNSKEIAELETYIKNLSERLSNESFTSKAPAAVVEGEKKKLEEAKERLAKLA